MKKVIAEFTDGLHIDTQFLITNVSKGVKNDGNRYLNVTLQDASGSIEGKKWDVTDNDLEILVPGTVVGISGEAYEYRNALQFKIFDIYPIDASQIDISRFVKPSPLPKEELIEKLNGYLASINDEEIKRLTTHLINKFYDSYINYPAAVRNHHAFGSGLLYHSITMAEVADKMCVIYPSLNRDYLIAGCLLHDIGKTLELSGPVATKYTLEGKLIGHISIMQ